MNFAKKLKKLVEFGYQEGLDSDHPDCPECGGVMDFYGHDEDGDFDYGDGYWECPDCGYSISEDEL